MPQSVDYTAPIFMKLIMHLIHVCVSPTEFYSNKIKIYNIMAGMYLCPEVK
jgi:hypothetical protein